MFIIRKYFEHDEWEEYRGEYQEAVFALSYPRRGERALLAVG